MFENGVPNPPSAYEAGDMYDVGGPACPDDPNYARRGAGGMRVVGYVMV
jgi:hypothetical protein